MSKKYNTEEERKEAKRRYWAKHREKLINKKKEKYYEHRDEMLEKMKKYYQEHKDEHNEYNKQYRKTQKGRAISLLMGYKRLDNKYNRGECTLTVQWIVENIFTKPCAHCGETDWHKLGCNRLDNSKPHTPDNVEPCCFNCNCKQPKKQMGQVNS